MVGETANFVRLSKERMTVELLDLVERLFAQYGT
jgi:hypothetical protein